MTREEAIAGLEEWARMSGGDPESAHAHADRILLKFLSELGYDDIVQAWHKVEKWYA